MTRKEILICNAVEAAIIKLIGDTEESLGATREEVLKEIKEQVDATISCDNLLKRIAEERKNRG